MNSSSRRTRRNLVAQDTSLSVIANTDKPDQRTAGRLTNGRDVTALSGGTPSGAVARAPFGGTLHATLCHMTKGGLREAPTEVAPEGEHRQQCGTTNKHTASKPNNNIKQQLPVRYPKMLRS